MPDLGASTIRAGPIGPNRSAKIGGFLRGRYHPRVTIRRSTLEGYAADPGADTV
jgi:hypothetical protein